MVTDIVSKSAAIFFAAVDIWQEGKMSKKKIAVLLGTIVVAAAAAAGIWYFLGNNGKDSNDRVYVEKVSKIMGTATGVQNRYSGVVQPQETVEINADSERTISEVFVEVGDSVEEGTPLFRYDTEDLSLEIEQAKLELENQDIEISNFNRQISDLEKERAKAAEADKFEYTTQIQTLQTQIKQSEFEKSSKKLEMDKLQKRIDNSQVLSTASGMIKSINDGNSPEESSAYITILSAGEYRIKGLVNEQNRDMIASGMDVIVRSRVDEEITWEGMIDSLDTGEPEDSSNDGMSQPSEDNTTSSSKYPFYVSVGDADGLVLGQHVLIELDNGQMEEKEGIWLYSGYIVFEGQEGSASGGGLMDGAGMDDDGEWIDDPGIGDDDGFLLDESGTGDDGDFTDESGETDDADSMDGASRDLNDGLSDMADGAGMDMGASLTGVEGRANMPDIADMERGDASFSDMGLDSMTDGIEDGDAGILDPSPVLDGTDADQMPGLMADSEMPMEGEDSKAYVWADNGNGRLEKRFVELGEYDMDLDQYEILSGLTEEDLIAFPMEGLYEGVKTVTDMEEVDYTSGLYNQEMGTEAGLEDMDLNMDGVDSDMVQDGMFNGGEEGLLDEDADYDDSYDDEDVYNDEEDSYDDEEVYDDEEDVDDE